MAEESNIGPQQPPVIATANVKLPKSPLHAYGPAVGLGGVFFGLMEIFRSDPKSGAGLLAQFGPKYLLWAGIAYMVYDLLKRALKPLNKAADNIGVMASNVGNLALSVNTLVNKEDRASEETRRLCSFSAQQSERAVELVSLVHDAVLRLEARAAAGGAAQ